MKKPLKKPAKSKDPVLPTGQHGVVKKKSTAKKVAPKKAVTPKKSKAKNFRDKLD